ncbi:MAG: DinB family protein [Bacteroidetes bacterium]|nr:DinB family protein [Bacteroidota bacterium]
MPLSPSALSRLEFQHRTIHDLIGDLPETVLRRNLVAGKWSAFENIAHLTAYQPVFIKRLERMQEESSPRFDRYIAEQDPMFAPTLQKGLGELLADIDLQRSRIIAQCSSMDDATLARTGIHPKYGEFSIRQWTEFFLLHEAHHLYTIFMLVQDLRKNGGKK